MLQKSRRPWLLTGLLGVAALFSISGTAAQQRALVLSGATLIDGTGGAPIADSLVVVQGARITAVGKRGQVSVPAGARVISLSGRTILPGLIDTHLHTLDWQLPMFLPWGVTSVADENNDVPWILTQRELLKTGKIKGPRMYVAGSSMDGMMGEEARPDSGFNYAPVATVEEARAYARSMVALGADIVKVHNNITDDQLRAAIEVANESGLPAMGHTQNIRRAAELGFKHDEHMWTVAFALLDPEDRTDIGLQSNTNPPPEALVNPKSFPPLVAYMAKQGVFVNPPIANAWGPATPRAQEMADEAAEVIKDKRLTFVPEAIKKSWVQIPERRAGWDNVKEFLRQYAVAGGKVVVGTDTGFNGHMIPGLAVHQEMQFFVDVGYSPMQAIQSATLWNAEFLRKEKDIGSIQPGRLGDFVIIEGDPLKDIRATRNVRMVIKDGQVMDTSYDAKWVNPVPGPYSSWSIPAPRINVTPKMAPQNGQTVTLTVEQPGRAGRGGLNYETVSLFAPDAIVRFDNTDLPTQFVSGTKLTATLDAGLLRKAQGSYAIYVVNPGIHGVVSAPVYFDVGSGQGQAFHGYTLVDGAVTFAKTPPVSSPLYGPTPRQAPQGGESLTIEVEGRGFVPSSVVHLGSEELPTKFVNGSKLTAQIPGRLLGRNPGSYVLYVVTPGPLGTVSAPGYFLVNLKQ